MKAFVLTAVANFRVVGNPEGITSGNLASVRAPAWEARHASLI
jgi:hypothetical protein